MLDIKFVRDNQEAVAEAMRNRHADWDGEKFAQLDEARRAAIMKEEALQAERNTLSKQIGVLMKDGKRDEADAAKACGAPSSLSSLRLRRGGRGAWLSSESGAPQGLSLSYYANLRRLALPTARPLADFGRANR